MALVIALSAGLIFGLGLTVSRMIDPAKVLGFLNLGGSWDPSLSLVMASAVLVALPAFYWVERRGRDLGGRSVAVPRKWPLDARLIAGSALFGVGWGLVGFCPGPAMASLGLGSGRSLIFVVAMAVGMLAVDPLWPRLRRAASPEAGNRVG
ncbi:MAG: YeeE/YedE family protein [Alphaproteobacteria bacterium]|nr:YeeE/YedE family protein [Alphaproteobacteria bacterium]